jgi:hypothetical protein
MKIIYYFLVFITVRYFLYSTNENVIAYYPFDNENCLDYSGNHYDGKPINNPTYVTGVSGKAIHLVGKGNFINKGQSVSFIGSYVELPFIDYSKYSNLTISLWVRFQNLSGVGEAYYYAGYHTDKWLGIFNSENQYLYDNTLRIFFAVGDNEWNQDINIIFDKNKYTNRWVNYVMTYDSLGLVKAYIDGVLIDSLKQKLQVSRNLSALGSHWWTYSGEERQSARFTGDIDEVKIFSKALSDEEVKKIANPCNSYFTFSIENNNNSLDFDSVAYATTNCKQIKITNISDSPEIISQTFLKYNIDFSVPQSQLPLIIQPQETKTLSVCLTPTKLGNIVDTLLIPNNCDTLQVPLSGVGSPNYYNSKTKCEVTLAGKTVQIVNGGYLNVKTDYIQQSQNLKIFIQTNFEGISNYEIYIYNYFGQRVKEFTFQSTNNNFNEFNLPFEGMPKGTYLIVLKAGNNIYPTTSFVF